MQLTLLAGRFAVCRLAADTDLPSWPRGELVSVTRSRDELSIVCEEGYVPEGVRSEAGWRALRVAGPLEFSQTGVLSTLAAPLAAAHLSIFVVSTFDTDYLLVKETHLEDAVRVLEAAGQAVTRGSVPQDPVIPKTA